MRLLVTALLVAGLWAAIIVGACLVLADVREGAERVDEVHAEHAARQRERCKR